MSMQSDLAGQVAVVTGGNSGIGRAIALGLADAGVSVAIIGRNRETLNSTLKALQAVGSGGAAAIAADISRVSEIEPALQQVSEMLGAIDILVNNAGIAILEPSTEVTEDHWEQVVGTNLKGLFFCASHVARQMIPRGKGNIINISSEEGIIGVPGHAAYCITKAGIIHMTKVLALEWGQHGIRVNCIAPAAVRTQMNETYWLADEEAYRWVIGRIALGRVSDPAEVVGAALYLASNSSSFVTGHTLVVDGGISAGTPRHHG